MGHANDHYAGAPLEELSAHELVINVEWGCDKIYRSVTLGELGWPDEDHKNRCGDCRSCLALARLEAALKEYS